MPSKCMNMSGDQPDSWMHNNGFEVSHAAGVCQSRCSHFLPGTQQRWAEIKGKLSSSDDNTAFSNLHEWCNEGQRCMHILIRDGEMYVKDVNPG